jgi:hypothetical protein
MRHFLKRFAPGADRFEGIETFDAPGSSVPVLKDCIAYMKVGAFCVVADHQRKGVGV